MCNPWWNRASLASFINGTVQEIGGGKEYLLYKSGGNLFYINHYAKGDDFYSYRIDSDGFHLIHNIRANRDYNVDGIDVTEAQYNIAYEQYFNDTDMVESEAKYTVEEMIQIIKNM